ncbi:alpha-tocopherol transfer protein-like [Sitophilus oryzae]|uniref:Alpha-tocopherol transfer protein-like n=2 Tax=Sitophilus oryzae TaxID=7048 RepID=A0A6J2YHU7_SITOR|nr:alpha-tocopherol transfer protein-like [Sitophilus oryzae]XP_030762847.1 alpha-tocopherol transfer protein-like [Sitophilus oryzae]
MSTQLLISTPCWPKSANDKANYKNELDINENSLGKRILVKIAEEDLRETESAKVECLKQLKIWIQQNTDIENCLMDDNFLLRFLRVKKFSIHMAQQTLLKYLNFRKRFKPFFYELGNNDAKINELLTNGYIYVSPVRDSKGRRVVIYDLSKFDPKKYTGTDMARAHVMTYEILLMSEENQILGVTHVADVRAINASFVTLFSVTDFATIIRWGEQSFPMRHKEIHFINMPQALKYVYDFAKNNMSQKIKERIMNHDSKLDLVQKINQRSLPAEFGGDISSKDMICWWKQEVDSKKKRLMAMDDMNLLSDRGIIRSKNSSKSNPENIIGSFRKLEVD